MKKCLIVLALITCSSGAAIGATMANTTGTNPQENIKTTSNTNNTKTAYTFTVTINQTTDPTVN